MDRNEIKNTFINILKKQGGVNVDALGSVTDDTDIVKDLGASSLAATKILMECENEFDIELDDDSDEMSFKVGDILDQLQAAIDED